MLWKIRKGNSTQYLDTATNYRYGVQRYNDGVNGSPWFYQIYAQPGVGRAEVLQDGYRSEEEAQGFLDEIMDGREFVEIQPPVTDEEKADAVVETAPATDPDTVVVEKETKK